MTRSMLVVEVNPVLPVDCRFIIQSLLLMGIRLFGWLLGEGIDAESVSFSFARNATDESLTYRFGPCIDYDCDVDFVRIDGRYGDAKLSCTHDQIGLILKSTRNL